MKTIKQVLEHNYNNFRFGIMIGLDLYRIGKFSRKKLVIHWVYCLLERMKPRHWLPLHLDFP